MTISSAATPNPGITQTMRAQVRETIRDIVSRHWGDIEEVIDKTGYKLRPLTPASIQLFDMNDQQGIRLYLYLDDPDKLMATGRGPFDRNHNGAILTADFDSVVLNIRRDVLSFSDRCVLGTIIISGIETLFERSEASHNPETNPLPVVGHDLTESLSTVAASFTNTFNPEGVPYRTRVIGQSLVYAIGLPENLATPFLSDRKVVDWMLDNYDLLASANWNVPGNSIPVRILELVVMPYSNRTGKEKGNPIIRRYNIRDPESYLEANWTNALRRINIYATTVMRDEGSASIANPGFMKAVMLLTGHLGADASASTATKRAVVEAIQSDLVENENLGDVLCQVLTAEIGRGEVLAWYNARRDKQVKTDLSEAVAEYNVAFGKSITGAQISTDPTMLVYRMIRDCADRVSEANRPRHALVHLCIQKLNQLSELVKGENGLKPEAPEVRQAAQAALTKIVHYLSTIKTVRGV